MPLRPGVSLLGAQGAQRGDPQGRQHPVLLLESPDALRSQKPCKALFWVSASPGACAATMGSPFPPPKPELHRGEILGHQSCDSASQALLIFIFFFDGSYQAKLSAQRKSASNPHPAVQPHGQSRAHGTQDPSSILPQAEHHPPRFKAIPGLLGPSCIQEPLSSGATSLRAARQERGCVCPGRAGLTGV